MRRERQATIARRLVVVSAVVSLACILVLIADWGVAVRRAPAELEQVKQLQEQAKTDPAIAETLHEKQERRTEASLGRENRGRIAAWVLLVSGALFVASGKWLFSLRPQRLPTLDSLVTVRFAPAPPARKAPKSPEAAHVAEEGTGLSFVDDLVERFGRGREAAIPILQAIQSRYRHLPDDVLRRVCELTEITPAQIEGTSSFYAQFRRSPVGRYVVRV
jgi:hypothetical protein